MLLVPLLWAASRQACGQVKVQAVPNPPTLEPLPAVTGGRMVEKADSLQGFPRVMISQWPGSYFRSAFAGAVVYFRVGESNEILHVVVDDLPVGNLVRPKPGVYAINGLEVGPHTAEVLVATESQAAPNTFGGFALPTSGRAQRPVQTTRAMEFIGDSHTVGYGDLSAKRQCTEEEIWANTDDTQAFGPALARHYGADYQVNAISGRGVVRNYNGFKAPTLPEAYPYTLFDEQQHYVHPAWQPQVVVIALGTNDFTTPLHPGERWTTRKELHADFEATYEGFLQQLRRRDPTALIVVWATDVAGGEVESEVKKVVLARQTAGDGHIRFVPVDHLQFSACNAHPSLADERTIADKLMETIDQDSRAWQAPGGVPAP